MEKILQAIAFLLFIIFINILLKKSIKKYENKNVEFNEKKISNLNQLNHFEGKLAYKGTLFLIIFLILQIIYLTIDYYFL